MSSSTERNPNFAINTRTFSAALMRIFTTCSRRPSDFFPKAMSGVVSKTKALGDQQCSDQDITTNMRLPVGLE